MLRAVAAQFWAAQLPRQDLDDGNRGGPTVSGGATSRLLGTVTCAVMLVSLFADSGTSPALAVTGLLCGIGISLCGFGLFRLSVVPCVAALMLSIAALIAELGVADGMVAALPAGFFGGRAGNGAGLSGFAYVALAAMAVTIPLPAILKDRPISTYSALASGHVAVALGALGLLCKALPLAGSDFMGGSCLGLAAALALVLLGFAQILHVRSVATRAPSARLAALPMLAGAMAAALALFLVVSNQEKASSLQYAQARALEGVDAVNRRFDVTENALLRIAMLMSQQRDVEQSEWDAAVRDSRSDLPGLVQCEIESDGRRSHSPPDGKHLQAGNAAWAKAFGNGPLQRPVDAGYVGVNDTTFLYFATSATGSAGHQVRIVAVFDPQQFMAATVPEHIAQHYSIRLEANGQTVYAGQDFGGTAPWSSFQTGSRSNWMLHLRPSPGYFRMCGSGLPVAVLIAGLLCGGLLAFSVHQSAQARRRAVELQSANRELTDSRGNLQQLIASLPEAMLVVTADGTIEEVGGTQLAVLARAGSTLVGRNVDEIIGLDEGGTALRDTKRVSGMEALVGRKIDATVRGENGMTNYCVIRISALETAQGRRFLWSVADIQWRKAAEEERTRLIQELQAQIEAYRELAARHSALINCGAIGMGLVDTNGRFMEFNETFAHTVGYSREELLNMSLKDLNHPDDQPLAVNYLAEMKQGTREGYQMLKRYLRKDGQEVWVDVTGAALRGKDGELRGIIGIMLNVSARVAATKALEASEQKLQQLNDLAEARNRELQAILEESRESAERFQKLLASAPEATILVDRAGRILEFNKRAQELLGYTEAEARAGTVEMLVPPEVRPRHQGIRDEYMIAPEQRVMARGRDLVAIAKDGSRIPVEINLSPLRYRGEALVAASMVDLRERLRAADELRVSEARLRMANKELESIVYVASHDMRSPLVNLQGFSRQLANAAQKLGPLTAKLPPEEKAQADAILNQEVPEAVGFIAASTRKMDGLIKGLLRLSRLGRAPLRMVRVDMNHLIAETLASTQFVLTQRNITVETGDLPQCWGDETQLGQVFSNLIDNAIKYRDPVAPGLIRIQGQILDDYAVYHVEDNGIGIAPNHQEHVFEIFHRLAPDGEVPGEGLGLSVVRRILDRHDGDIRLQSTPGVGSRFTVILPRVAGARGSSEVKLEQTA